VVVDCAAAADTSVFVSAASDTKDGAKEGKGDGSSSSALHTCGFGQFGQLANGKYIHYSESIVPVKAFQEFTLNNSNSNNNRYATGMPQQVVLGMSILLLPWHHHSHVSFLASFTLYHITLDVCIP